MNSIQQLNRALLRTLMSPSTADIVADRLEELEGVEAENKLLRIALEEIHTDAHCAAKAGPLSIPTLEVAWNRFSHIAARATSALCKRNTELSGAQRPV